MRAQFYVYARICTHKYAYILLAHMSAYGCKYEQQYFRATRPGRAGEVMLSYIYIPRHLDQVGRVGRSRDLKNKLGTRKPWVF